MKMLKLLCVLLLVTSPSFLLVSCGDKPEPTQGSRLTMGEVKRNIVKGQTTQAEILSYFGSPNLVSKNKQNNEVWAYNKMAYDSSSSASGVNLIFVGGSKASTSSTSRSIDLVITFNKNDIVKDYSIVQAAY